MFMPKGPIFKNYGKTLCFSIVFEDGLMSIKYKNDMIGMSKNNKKNTFFSASSEHTFSIDF